jgi:putative ABC transport system permease protein
MIRNYILIAWRNFVKYRTFSIINIVGFALAMASCFLIVFHIRSEISYEKNIPGYENIYRVHAPQWAKSSPPLAQSLSDFYPAISSTVRFFEFSSGEILSYGSYQTVVNRSFLADSTAIEMFGYEFIEGNPETSLRAPFTAVLSESLAKRVFGNTEAVGKTITLGGDNELTVSGVIKDMPENTHLRFDILVAFSTLYKRIPESWTSNRMWMGPYTYAYIQPGQLDKVKSRVLDFQENFYQGMGTIEEIRQEVRFEFQPIKDIHLHSHLEQELSENSNASYLYIFTAVALFILLIASVNFVNLNISLAFRRMKETGLRKVLGAVRSQLVKQYLAETLLTSVVALVLALTLFFAVIPNYNSLAGRDVQMSDVLTIENIGILAALIIGVSLLAGAYPAFFISGFKPTDALKSQGGPGSSTPVIRKALVVFQFAVSAFMIASTIIIVRQMSFFQNQDLGFNKDQVIAVGLHGELAQKMSETPDAIKAELKRDPSILHVARTSTVPGDLISVESIVPENADPGAEFPGLRVINIDDETLSTLQIPVIEGREFSLEFNDSAKFIVNKAALKALNITDAIGTRITNQTREQSGPIVGVVDDFHFSSLHNVVEPLVLEYRPGWTDHLLLKVNTTDMPATIARIEHTIRSLAPANLFSYNFYDDKWNAQYKEEAKMNVLFNTFSVFMIVISCIGLFGLSAITMQTRRKEIGIRKVVGASTSTIIRIMSKEFVILVAVGSLIGLPIAWFAMNSWLSGFAYKTTISPDVFVISIVACVVIALGSVLFNAFKAARTNPVDSLRSE